MRRHLLGGALVVDRRYVYVGLPEGAGVPNCTRVTYDAKKKEGCATYTVKGGADGDRRRQE